MTSVYSSKIEKIQLPSRFRKTERISKEHNNKCNKNYISNNKFEPEHISSSPPNEFLKNLQSRIGIYYNTE